MLVKDCMTRHPVMAPPTMLAAEAQHLMQENHIRHLPVVGDGKRLLGLVTQMSFSLDPGTLGSLDVWEITRHLSRLTYLQVDLTRVVAEADAQSKRVATLSMTADVRFTSAEQRAEFARALEEAVTDIVTWTDGTFDVIPKVQPPATGVVAQLSIDVCLTVARRRAERMTAIMGVLGLSTTLPGPPGFLGTYQFGASCGIALFFPQLATAAALFTFVSYVAQIITALLSLGLGMWLMAATKPSAQPSS